MRAPPARIEPPKPSRTEPRRQDAAWAALTKHSVGLNVLARPRCDGRSKLVGIHVGSKEVTSLVEHLRPFGPSVPRRPESAPPAHETHDFE